MLQVVEAVLEFARNNEIKLITEVTNFTLVPLSKNRNRFQGVSPLALGPHAAIEVAADKFRTICLARELQIHVPETVLVSSVEDLGRIAAKWDFPVVVKDRLHALERQSLSSRFRGLCLLDGGPHNTPVGSQVMRLFALPSSTINMNPELLSSGVNGVWTNIFRGTMRPPGPEAIAVVTSSSLNGGKTRNPGTPWERSELLVGTDHYFPCGTASVRRSSVVQVLAA